LVFLLSAPAKRSQGFPGQFVRRDHEYTVRFSVRDIDDAQVPARRCSAQSNPGTLAARPILAGFLQNIDDLGFVNLVVMNMR
jgi:hypothetical protein